MKYKKMMWLFSSFSWCSSSEELGNRNLKILKFPTDDLKKKKINQNYFLLFALHSCSLDCGLAVLDFVPEAVLTVFLHGRFHTMKYTVWVSVSCRMCSAAEFCVHGMVGKRRDVPRGAAHPGIWHFLSFTSPFVGAAQCWWRRVDKPSSCSGVSLGRVFVCCVLSLSHTAAVTPIPPLPLPLPDILSNLSILKCCRELDCVASFVFPPWFHGRFLCTKNEQDLRNDLCESTSSVLWSHGQSCPQPH